MDPGVIDALGKSMATLLTVSRDNDGVDFLAELLGVLARGHLCQVSSDMETMESIVENLVDSFSTGYSNLKKKRGDQSSCPDVDDRRVSEPKKKRGDQSSSPDVDDRRVSELKKKRGDRSSNPDVDERRAELKTKRGDPSFSSSISIFADREREKERQPHPNVRLSCRSGSFRAAREAGDGLSLHGVVEEAGSQDVLSIDGLSLSDEWEDGSSSEDQVTVKEGGMHMCGAFQFMKASQQSGATRPPQIIDLEKEPTVEPERKVTDTKKEVTSPEKEVADTEVEATDSDSESTVEGGYVKVLQHEGEELEYFVEEEEDSGGTGELVTFTVASSCGRLGPASRPISHALSLRQQTLIEQRRSNSLKEMELVCAMKGLQLKERELDMQVEAIDIGRETLDVNRSTLKFNVSKAERDAVAADCADFRSSTSDYFVAGLLIMFGFTGYCVWKNLPEWFKTLSSSCAATPTVTKKAWYHWNFVGSITSNTGYLLCIARGCAGGIVGLLLCVLLLFVCKKTLSSSKNAMPMTIFLVGGSFIGLVGRAIIDLLGGQGWNWMVVWLLSCVLHACTHFFTEFFVKLLSRSRIAAILFHVCLAVGLPLGAGLAGFPSAFPSLKSFLAGPAKF